jgi:hypothetical protein
VQARDRVLGGKGLSIAAKEALTQQ